MNFLTRNFSTVGNRPKLPSCRRRENSMPIFQLSCCFSNSLRNTFELSTTPKTSRQISRPCYRSNARSIVRIRSAIERWRRSCWYVRVKRNALRRCGIFSKASDRDIKKGRATSCPAGGHWRGINHPREGLHFNAPGWISTERVERSARLAPRPPIVD